MLGEYYKRDFFSRRSGEMVRTARSRSTLRFNCARPFSSLALTNLAVTSLHIDVNKQSSEETKERVINWKLYTGVFLII